MNFVRLYVSQNLLSAPIEKRHYCPRFVCLPLTGDSEFLEGGLGGGGSMGIPQISKLSNFHQS